MGYLLIPQGGVQDLQSPLLTCLVGSAAACILNLESLECWACTLSGPRGSLPPIVFWLRALHLCFLVCLKFQGWHAVHVLL